MNVLLEEFVLPPDLEKILDNSPSIIIPKTEEMLYGLIFGNNGTNTNQVDVCYRVNGELVKEAVVSRCKNGAAVNFTEDYMRRRDPDCMRIGDDLPSDHAFEANPKSLDILMSKYSLKCINLENQSVYYNRFCDIFGFNFIRKNNFISGIYNSFAKNKNLGDTFECIYKKS